MSKCLDCPRCKDKAVPFATDSRAALHRIPLNEDRIVREFQQQGRRNNWNHLPHQPGRSQFQELQLLKWSKGKCEPAPFCGPRDMYQRQPINSGFVFNSTELPSFQGICSCQPNQAVQHRAVVFKSNNSNAQIVRECIIIKGKKAYLLKRYYDCYYQIDGQLSEDHPVHYKLELYWVVFHEEKSRSGLADKDLHSAKFAIPVVLAYFRLKRGAALPTGAEALQVPVDVDDDSADDDAATQVPDHTSLNGAEDDPYEDFVAPGSETEGTGIAAADGSSSMEEQLKAAVHSTARAVAVKTAAASPAQTAESSSRLLDPVMSSRIDRPVRAGQEGASDATLPVGGHDSSSGTDLSNVSPLLDYTASNGHSYGRPSQHARRYSIDAGSGDEDDVSFDSMKVHGDDTWGRWSTGGNKRPRMADSYLGQPTAPGLLPAQVAQDVSELGTSAVVAPVGVAQDSGFRFTASASAGLEGGRFGSVHSV